MVGSGRVSKLFTFDEPFRVGSVIQRLEKKQTAECTEFIPWEMLGFEWEKMLTGDCITSN